MGNFDCKESSKVSSRNIIGIMFVDKLFYPSNKGISAPTSPLCEKFGCHIRACLRWTKIRCQHNDYFIDGGGSVVVVLTA